MRSNDFISKAAVVVLVVLCIGFSVCSCGCLDKSDAKGASIVNASSGECVWQFSGNDLFGFTDARYDRFETSCGHYYMSDPGRGICVHSNEYEYCPYCGNRIIYYAQNGVNISEKSR